MKIINLYFIILIFLLLSCRENLPDNYGTYISSGHELYLIKSQNAIVRGNLLNSISGLKSASGSCFNEVKNLIIYDKDIDPKILSLSKLHFQKGAFIPDLLGNYYVDLNFWTVETEIPINI